MRIKNWEQFQHYRDRNPTWIKCYRSLLDDDEYFDLPPEAAKYLLPLWLIASEYGGELPSKKKLAFRLHTTETKVELILSNLSHWLEQDASDVLAEPEQVAIPEKEKEIQVTSNKTDTEEEGEAPNGVTPHMLKAAFDSYNQKARELGLPEAKVLSPERRVHLRKRLEEHGLGGWFDALNAISSQGFLLGKNNRGWRLSFDFLLRPESLNKVRERAYLDKKFSRFEEEGRELIERARERDRQDAERNNVVYLESPEGSEGGTKQTDKCSEGESGNVIPLCAGSTGVDDS